MRKRSPRAPFVFAPVVLGLILNGCGADSDFSLRRTSRTGIGLAESRFTKLLNTLELVVDVHTVLVEEPWRHAALQRICLPLHEAVSESSRRRSIADVGKVGIAGRLADEGVAHVPGGRTAELLALAAAFLGNARTPHAFTDAALHTRGGLCSRRVEAAHLTSERDIVETVAPVPKDAALRQVGVALAGVVLVEAPAADAARFAVQAERYVKIAAAGALQRAKGRCAPGCPGAIRAAEIERVAFLTVLRDSVATDRAA